MSVEAVEELRSSLKNLYNDPQYSDLTIASRDAEYRVHKAIVCPRSDFFAAQCRDSNSKAADGYLSLPDDDPQAIGMIVRYFYHLDYPSEPTTEVPLTNGHAHTNGHVDSQFNGTDDDSLNSFPVKEDDQPPADKEAKIEDPEPLDDFLPPQPQKLSKKQKKRAKAQAKHEAERVGSPDPQTDSMASPVAPETLTTTTSQPQENHSDGGGAFLDAKVSPQNGVAAPTNGTTNGNDDDTTTKSLTLHANVYALSRKYGIAGLRALAFAKFQTEADSQWHTEEFLRAAEKVYTSCGDDVDGDREMKDVVVGMICRHGELMDKAETQKVIRTLPKDLMYDILMQVRQQGGFAI